MSEIANKYPNMIPFVDAAKEPMKEVEKCLDPLLWQACAGSMVHMPTVRSLVYYFPQGHAEHAYGAVDFGSPSDIPAYILCRVDAVKFMADRNSDEIFAKMSLVPVFARSDYAGFDGIGVRSDEVGAQEKPVSFAKTLTQSDANNGGGFSVPRYCAETIFPPLDYSLDPPVQTVFAKDVHGVLWKFRHIYRGTPRRHLLTTGWSTFVNEKKLVAGDTIVFLRMDNGDIFIGIRRVKRGIGGGLEPTLPWNSSRTPLSGGKHSGFSRAEENKNGITPIALMRGRARVSPESVVEATKLAVNGKAFEIVYYPRAGTPEFCVKAGSVRAAMRINWWAGMRFKMAFETEDSSRISWFMGTISSVQVVDPVRWPNSPWRLLQVAWDEPDLLHNVKCVSPWLVEVISPMPGIHLPSFPPPSKKLCISPPPQLPFEGCFSSPVFHGSPLGHSSNPLSCVQDSTPAGVQGARHAQIGISLTDLQFNKLQSSLSSSGLLTYQTNESMPISAHFISNNRPSCDDVARCLATGVPANTNKSSNGDGTPKFMLFGKPIFTELQICNSNSGTVSTVLTTNSSSNENLEKVGNVSESSGSPVNHRSGVEKSSSEEFQVFKDHCFMTELKLQPGQCKVFLESEDVGCIVDLILCGSYDELYRKIAGMLRIEKTELVHHMVYFDADGTAKLAGNEPFSEFMKTARRLLILTDSGSVNSASLRLPPAKNSCS